MRYDLAAEQEYARFQANFGAESLHEPLQNLQNMLAQQMSATASMLNAISAAHSENSDKVLEAINRPRNRTVIRDAEGKISGVRDE